MQNHFWSNNITYAQSLWLHGHFPSSRMVSFSISSGKELHMHGRLNIKAYNTWTWEEQSFETVSPDGAHVLGSDPDLGLTREPGMACFTCVHGLPELSVNRLMLSFRLILALNIANLALDIPGAVGITVNCFHCDGFSIE